MAHRLSESRSFPPPTAPKNQTFEVTCACGEMLTGTRQIKPQTLSCPHCGSPVFVLPVDCYAPTPHRHPRSHATPTEKPVSRGMIAKLNRLAFWTRIREQRAHVGGRLSSVARHMGRWCKRRLSSLRLW